MWRATAVVDGFQLACFYFLDCLAFLLQVLMELFNFCLFAVEVLHREVGGFGSCVRNKGFAHSPSRMVRLLQGGAQDGYA